MQAPRKIMLPYLQTRLHLATLLTSFLLAGLLLHYFASSFRHLKWASYCVFLLCGRTTIADFECGPSNHPLSLPGCYMCSDIALVTCFPGCGPQPLWQLFGTLFSPCLHPVLAGRLWGSLNDHQRRGRGGRGSGLDPMARARTSCIR